LTQLSFYEGVRNYVAPHPIAPCPVGSSWQQRCFPPLPLAQSQDTQSVAEASAAPARRRRTPKSRPKVITDETLVVKKGDVQSATAEQLQNTGFAGNADAARRRRSKLARLQESFGRREGARGFEGARRFKGEDQEDAQSDLDLLQP